jgi:drug/metabolite transporter (DMT)-like permease
MAAFFLASVCFGAMAVCVRLAAADMAATQVACVRFAGSLLVLLLATRARALRPRPGNARRLLLRGVLGATAITCYYIGIGRAGAALATMLHSTYPVFTALFAVLLLGEPLTAALGVALALNAAGTVVVLGTPSVAGTQVGSGALVALLGGVLAGGALATASELRRSETASLVTIWFMAVGALLTAPSFLLGTPAWSAALGLALVGVVLTSAAGQWLLHHGLGFVSATTGSLAAATGVVTTAVLEALVLGQRLPARVAAGGLLMLVAVGLASRAHPPAAVDEAVAD